MKRTLTAWALGALVVCAQPADAGEGRITKIRGRTLTIDKGADDGLEVGLEVTIVRLPDEAIIHPLTGENLGAPEIESRGPFQQGLRPCRIYSTGQQPDHLDPTR